MILKSELVTLQHYKAIDCVHGIRTISTKVLRVIFNAPIRSLVDLLAFRWWESKLHCHCARLWCSQLKVSAHEIRCCRHVQSYKGAFKQIDITGDCHYETNENEDPTFLKSHKFQSVESLIGGLFSYIFAKVQ